MRRARRLLAALVLAACTERGTSADAALGVDVVVQDAGICACAPGVHAERVVVLADDGDLWSFDPRTLAFERLAGPICGGGDRPFSMAVDSQGNVLVMLASARALRTTTLADPITCSAARIDTAALGAPFFGLAYVRDPVDRCDRLFMHSYSGEGPFREGEDLGVLGRVDPGETAATRLASTDYDGAELTGTGDGSVYVLGGGETVVIAEHDRASGAELARLPLAGLRKTNASAFAFFAGDLWIFTEAQPAGCEACLQMECGEAHAACAAEPSCAADLACAIERGELTDACGGLLSAELHTCVGRTCTDACLTSPSSRHSEVSRVDWDRSDGAERTLSRRVTEAPIRIVGAGLSPCVQTTPF